MPQLTQDLIDRAVPPAPPGGDIAAPDETRLRAEIAVFLRGRDPRLGLWVFAHGALMWDHAEAAPDIVAPARLPGFARRYGLRDTRHHGTPAAPGLAFGLEKAPALASPGLLLHLPGPGAATRLLPLWRREMGSGSQDAGWHEATMHAGRGPGGAPMRALCFTTRTTGPGYAGDLPVAAVADTLARARGRDGAAASHLLQAATTLRANGMRDAMLESLEAEVARRLTR